MTQDQLNLSIEQLLTQTLLFDIIISPDITVKAGSNYAHLLTAIRERNRQLLSGKFPLDEIDKDWDTKMPRVDWPPKI